MNRFDMLRECRALVVPRGLYELNHEQFCMMYDGGRRSGRRSIIVTTSDQIYWLGWIKARPAGIALIFYSEN